MSSSSSSGWIGYFNSIKVRLERLITFASATLALRFQFHKGTIRTYDILLYLSALSYFNSIKVRLELIYALGLIAAYLFQFHKGTIRTQTLNGSQNYQ